MRSTRPKSWQSRPSWPRGSRPNPGRTSTSGSACASTGGRWPTSKASFSPRAPPPGWLSRSPCCSARLPSRSTPTGSPPWGLPRRAPGFPLSSPCVTDRLKLNRTAFPTPLDDRHEPRVRAQSHIRLGLQTFRGGLRLGPDPTGAIFRDQFLKMGHDGRRGAPLQQHAEIREPPFDGIQTHRRSLEDLDLLVVGGKNVLAFGDQFLVELLAGTEPREPDLDLLVRSEAGQPDHVA